MELFILSGMLVVSFGVAIERTKLNNLLAQRDAKITALFAENVAVEVKALELLGKYDV
jgi:hypothetical protein